MFRLKFVYSWPWGCLAIMMVPLLVACGISDGQEFEPTIEANSPTPAAEDEATTVAVTGEVFEATQPPSSLTPAPATAEEQTPTSEFIDDAPTATATPESPKATDPPPQPTASRSATTGIPEIDKTIAVILSNDLEAKRELVRLTTVGCTIAQGLGGPPLCDIGQAEGTLVEYFPVRLSMGESPPVLPEEVDRSLDFMVDMLYAAYWRADIPVREVDVPWDYGLIFSASEEDAFYQYVQVHVDRLGQIVSLGYLSCPVDADGNIVTASFLSCTPGSEIKREAGQLLVAPPYDPFPLADLPRQYLELDTRPQDLHGHELLSLGFDGELYLTDLESGETSQLTDDGRSKFSGVLSDQYIAWLVEEGQQTVQVDGQDEQLRLHNIVVYDRQSGRQQTITDEPAPRVHLVLDGERLVWMDKRNELAEHYTHYDIYTYDLESGEETAIVVAPGSQVNPDLHRELLVWQDNRKSPFLGSPTAGCENCPDNRYDIYLHDFRSEESRPVIEDEFLKSNPSVYGQQIVWQRFFRPKQADLSWLNLNTGVIGQLTETVDSEIQPQIDGDRVLWQVSQDCDVINIGPGGEELTYNTGIYVMDFNSDKPLRLTDYIEPLALIDGDTVVITESCMADFEVFHLSLPAGD